MLDIRDFYPLGSTPGDWAPALQAALLTAENAGGGEVVVPRGRYGLGAQSLIGSRTRLVGDGAFYPLSGFPVNQPLLRNRNIGSYVDEKITLEGLTFDGENLGAGASQTRFTELVSLGTVTQASVLGVDVMNHQYIGLAMGGCRASRLEHGTFSGLGYQGTTTNGGSALLISSSGANQSEDVSVKGYTAKDCHWHGLHFSVKSGSLFDIRARNVKEAGIFASRLLPNIDMSAVSMSHIDVKGVRKKHTSAHGMELGGIKYTLSQFHIEDCDHGGLALTDPQDVSVSNGAIGNVTKVAGAIAGGIDMNFMASGATRGRNVRIGSGVRVYDDQATPTTRHAVWTWGPGGLPAPVGVAVKDNDFTAPFTSGVWALNAYASAVKRKDNLGTTDENW